MGQRPIRLTNGLTSRLPLQLSFRSDRRPETTPATVPDPGCEPHRLRLGIGVAERVDHPQARQRKQIVNSVERPPEEAHARRVWAGYCEKLERRFRFLALRLPFPSARESPRLVPAGFQRAVAEAADCGGTHDRLGAIGTR